MVSQTPAASSAQASAHAALIILGVGIFGTNTQPGGIDIAGAGLSRSGFIFLLRHFCKVPKLEHSPQVKRLRTMRPPSPRWKRRPHTARAGCAQWWAKSGDRRQTTFRVTLTIEGRESGCWAAYSSRRAVMVRRPPFATDSGRGIAALKGGAVRSKRLLEHVRRQDWVAVAIEFVIVVVGVLLAMQVTNWNDQRLERERGRAYYDRILTELRSNIEDMDQRAAYYEQAIGHAEAALTAFHQPASTLDEQFLIDLYQASQIQTGPITRASYEEAVSSGALLHVGNPQLRVRLANFFALADASPTIWDETTPYRDRIRGLLLDPVQLRIQSDCNDITTTDAQGMTTSRLPTQCALHLTAQQVAQAIAVVRAAPDLETDLTRWLSSARQKVIQYRLISRSAGELVDTMAPRA